MNNLPDGYLTRAEPADANQISHLVATAFHALAPSEWLIPDEEIRREVFAPYFRIYVDLAMAHGTVYTTADRAAAALWVSWGVPAESAGSGGLALLGQPAQESAEDHDARLAAVTGEWVDRFREFDATLDKHHPLDVPHDHLAILAVHPDRQRTGLGGALLSHHLDLLDRAQTPAYLEASDTGTRSLYLRYGFEDLGEPIQLQDGPKMYPMWRQPARPDLREAA